jgi:hypothetical protein
MFDRLLSLVLICLVCLCISGCPAPDPAADSGTTLPSDFDPVETLAIEDTPGLAQVMLGSGLILQADSGWWMPLSLHVEESVEVGGWSIWLQSVRPDQNNIRVRVTSQQPLTWSFWDVAGERGGTIVGMFRLAKTSRLTSLDCRGHEWDPASLVGQETDTGWEMRISQRGQSVRNQRAFFFTFRDHIPLAVEFHDQATQPLHPTVHFTPKKAALPAAPAHSPSDPNSVEAPPTPKNP